MMILSLNGRGTTCFFVSFICKIRYWNVHESLQLLFQFSYQARSQHYDLVMNGCEVGGGSIRVHDSAMQRHILHNILGIEAATLGFLNEALECGAPPHGGIALGQLVSALIFNLFVDIWMLNFLIYK